MATNTVRKSLLRRRPDFVQIDPTHSLADGLVFAGIGGYPGSTTLKDQSLYNNDGTLTNMTPSEDWVWSAELGRWGTNYDHTGGRVIVPGLGDAMNGGDWTVSLFTAGVSVAGICSFGGLAPMFRYTGGVWQMYYGGSNYAFATTVPISDHTHVAFIYRDGVLGAVVDGVLDANQHTLSITLSSDYAIGAGTTSGGYSWYDPLYDALLHNRALTLAEIQRLADPSNVMLDGLIREQYSRAIFPAPQDSGTIFNATTIAMAVSLPGYPPIKNQTLDLTL